MLINMAEGSSFYEQLKEWVKDERIHVESFDYAMQHSLNHVIQNIPPVEFFYNGKCVSVFIKDVSISNPVLMVGDTQEILFPSECRLRGLTYSSPITLSLLWNYDGKEIYGTYTKQIPLMLKSVKCNLKNLTAKELRKNKEEEEESGGYFIVNGKERIFRHFLTIRRNYPFAIINPYWKKKGKKEDYTEFGVKMRCVSSDGTISNTVLRYCVSGMVDVMFQYEGRYRFIPLGLLLKSLVKETDHSIFKSLVTDDDDIFYKECILKMLRVQHEKGIYTQEQAVLALGKLFSKIVFKVYNKKVIANLILRRGVLVHLEENVDKFNLLCYITRKLFSLVQKQCANDDTENIMNQEVLLSGQLYLLLLKHEMKGYVKSVAKRAEKIMKQSKDNLHFAHAVDSSMKHGLCDPHIEHALCTGNIPINLGLSMTTGVSLLCERSNMLRFKSYFSAVEKFSTSSYGLPNRRYLQPEAYGFICPVHTPDGDLTGLKNHLAVSAKIVTSQSPTKDLIELLLSLGLQHTFTLKDVYHVFVDGLIVGVVNHKNAKRFVSSVRSKRNAIENESYLYEIFLHMEVVFISKTDCQLYPGIFIFTSAGRLIRPLKNLVSKKTEFIGCFEQTFLHVCTERKERIKKITTHQEIKRQCILNSLAGMIPFCESNQSPRNILACQMAKQAIGIASHIPWFRGDTKLHQLTYPQCPTIVTPMYEANQVDEYPCGINAVIAIISYSGFDMEDAIVFNKSSLEHGLFNCQILKTKFIDLKVEAKNLQLAPSNTLKFERGNYYKIEEKLGDDGLSYVGQKLEFGDPLCSYTEKETGINHLFEYKSENTAYVQNVKLLGDNENPEDLTTVSIQLSIVRPVEVGDKFASRHGQKGVCGFTMAAENMPFSENGIIPDILFNPHGFPSRMTIGMMIELLAGKVAVLEGNRTVIEPFQPFPCNSAVDYYCQSLLNAGYNSNGMEKFISGVSGQELEAEVFTGIVYYQRLSHMVEDKYQVRSEGKVDPATQQPVKGFKTDGAVKFGEMERDSLISHGASFLLHDRFLECSDKYWVCICRNCERIFCPRLTKKILSEEELGQFSVCRLCGNRAKLEIAIPYIFMYLIAELSFLNIKVIVN